jgi:hypothetical protein
MSTDKVEKYINKKINDDDLVHMVKRIFERRKIVCHIIRPHDIDEELFKEKPEKWNQFYHDFSDDCKGLEDEVKFWFENNDSDDEVELVDLDDE